MMMIIRGTPPPADVLDRRWFFAIYGSLLVPFVGPLVLILLSSIAYYAVRRQQPRTAAILNRHAWIAWAIGLAVNTFLFVVRSH